MKCSICGREFNSLYKINNLNVCYDCIPTKLKMLMTDSNNLSNLLRDIKERKEKIDKELDIRSLIFTSEVSGVEVYYNGDIPTYLINLLMDENYQLKKEDKGYKIWKL